MKYNIEEHEDYLKHNTPYRMDEEAWEALQQRLKTKVLAAQQEPLPVKARRFPIRMAAGLAAGIALLVSVYVVRQQDRKDQLTIQTGMNAEQQLDKSISGLNETELNWIHQLNEEELSEQNEYSEN